MNQITNKINSESLLTSVFADAIDGIMLVNEVGIIVYVNKAMTTIFQFQENEIIGQKFTFFLPNEDQNEKVEDIRQVAKGINLKMGAGFEVLGRKKDETEIPVFLSLSRFIDDNKIYYTGIVHDLSGFKDTQNKLLRERTLLQRYLLVTNSLIIELNSEGKIMLFNQKAEEITGYSAVEVIGKNWFDLILEPNLVKVFQAEWEAIFSGKQKLIEFLTHKLITKSGEIKIIKWHSLPNLNKDNKIESVLASGIDITQLMNTERELKLLNSRLEKEVSNRTEELVTVVSRLLKTNRKLDSEIQVRENVEIALLESEAQLRLSLEKEMELNQLKSRFLSMASHEFKTPISTVLSSISILEKYEEGDISEKKQKHFKRIKGALHHMTFMLDDFFSISKFEEGRINTKEEMLNLNDFFMKIIEAFQNNLKENQTIQLQGLSQNFNYKTDPNLLKQIVLNLLSNASKYSESGDTITIRIVEKDQYLNFEIEDSGMGIPQEDQKHLFTRFFRAENVSHIKGTGLGLNIVRDYVTLLKGNIRLSSKQGKGSLFIVSLPKPKS